MTFGSLFAGIGGFDLGLERAGMECRWQVEIDPYATRVLAKHWPHVRRWDDVRTFPPSDGEWEVDLICGGFPCQDVSSCGQWKGIISERSGLWFEYAKVIRILRPSYIIIENVKGLLDRGFEYVLGSLALLGYDAEWSLVSSCSMGAPHMRSRLFIVAYLAGQHTINGIYSQSACENWQEKRWIWCRQLASSLADAIRNQHEPTNSRIADDFPEWVDRLRCLGNAVVPQVAEWIGRRIMEAAKEAT